MRDVALLALTALANTITYYETRKVQTTVARLDVDRSNPRDSCKTARRWLRRVGLSALLVTNHTGDL